MAWTSITRFGLHRSTVFPLILFVLLSAFTSAAISQEARKQPAQESGKQLAQEARKQPASKADKRLAKLPAFIEQTREAWSVPGLSVAIVKDGEVVLCQGFGKRTIDSAEAVNEQTLFAIASNSKAFTAAALAILVDEGELNWDDHVSDYLPWLKLKDLHATHDLRIRDLLCHRSGLGTFSGDLLWWGTPYTPREVLERAVELEPAAPFRSKYGYSNLMFLAAGQVIEEVSGVSWQEFVQQRLLAPVEMNRTVTSVRDLVSRGNYATPHKTLLDASNEWENRPIPWMNWDTMAAAGGIISSAEDMAKWIQVQLDKGQLPDDEKLFSEVQSQSMWQSHTPIPVSSGYQSNYPSTHFRSYGLGWALSDYLGRKIVGHGGGYDGMYSQVVMVPEENLGIVVLTNSMTGISPAITYHVLDAYLGGENRDWSTEKLSSFRRSRIEFQARISRATTPIRKDTTMSHELSDYAGHFRCPLYGEATVSVEDDQRLVLRLLPNPALVADLKHLHYDTFEIRWRNEFAWFGGGTVTFVADQHGLFQRLILDVPNDDLWFYELDLRRQAP